MSAVKPFADDFLNAFNMSDKEVSTHEEWLLREYSKLMQREVFLLKKEMQINRREQNKSELQNNSEKKQNVGNGG
jgi:hypothetical protein